MALHEGNEQNFDELVIQKKGTVLVDFYAQWCGPCKMIAPALHELGEEGFEIVKIDTDANEDLMREYSVMSVPTLVFFKDGIEQQRKTGFAPGELIREILESL